jgi:hypothetical protein
MYAGCSLVWVSKLQTAVALSTTEAEYIALSHTMHELIPLLGLLKELTPVFHHDKDQPHMFWKSCGYAAPSNKYLPTYMKKIQEPMNLLRPQKCDHTQNKFLSNIITVGNMWLMELSRSIL